MASDRKELGFQAWIRGLGNLVRPGVDEALETISITIVLAADAAAAAPPPPPTTTAPTPTTPTTPTATTPTPTCNLILDRGMEAPARHQEPWQARSHIVHPQCFFKV